MSITCVSSSDADWKESEKELLLKTVCSVSFWFGGGDFGLLVGYFSLAQK